MFKGLVTKLAKDAWDNAGKPAPQPAAAPKANTKTKAAPRTERKLDICYAFEPEEGYCDGCREKPENTGPAG